MDAKATAQTPSQGAPEIEDLRARLLEAEETLRAIRSGEADALIVATEHGDQVFTLQGADRSYRALVEDMNEGALSLTPDGMILYANRKFAALLRTPLEHVIGSTIDRWIAPDGRAVLPALLADAPRKNCRAELTLAASDGTLVPVYLSVNSVSLDGLHQSLCMVATDLTEPKRAEQALRLSETKFRNFFENSLLGNRLVSPAGDVVVNKAFCDMLGYSDEELRAKTWQEITHPDDLPRTAEAYEQLREGAAVTVRLEQRYLHKSGRVVWGDATFTAARDEVGGLVHILISVYDITARKQADAAVLDLQQHLQRNIEMERLRLAQDLHDVLLQQLYAVIYDLESMRGRSDAATSDALSRVIGSIQTTLNSLRSVASELRPPTLSRFGLEKAVLSYVQDFREKYPGIQVSCYLARDEQSLPEDLRLVLFRVMQEALVNIARHADATIAQVRFNFDAEDARIEISDNGKGFAVPADWLSLVRAGHYGLAGMAERVSAAGGALTLESSPGGSTTVRAIVPY